MHRERRECPKTKSLHRNHIGEWAAMSLRKRALASNKDPESLLLENASPDILASTVLPDASTRWEGGTPPRQRTVSKTVVNWRELPGFEQTCFSLQILNQFLKVSILTLRNADIGDIPGFPQEAQDSSTMYDVDRNIWSRHVPMGTRGRNLIDCQLFKNTHP
ncbi:protein of unknown function [Candidatus Filomicrobium marinum]|nr:protein of unknown function [Candidatus Filomicrobium marinum]